MRFTTLAVVALATLAACTETITEPPEEQDFTCAATPDSNLVGQSIDVLAAMTFPAPMRIIKPGMVVAQDYNPGRLNIDVDRKDIITRVWCG